MVSVENTEAVKERFEEQGYVVIEDVLPEELLSNVRRDIDSIVEKFGRPEEIRDDTLVRLAKEEGWKADKAMEASVLFRQLPSFHGLEPNFQDVFQSVYPKYDLSVTCLNDVLVGFPGDVEFFDWHQEAAYMGEDEIANLWYPLVEDATTENGALRLLEGSHEEGALDWEEEIYEPEFGGTLSNRVPQNIEHFHEKYDEVVADIDLGDVLVLHSHLLHKSGQIHDESVRLTGVTKMAPIRDSVESEYPGILKVTPLRD